MREGRSFIFTWKILNRFSYVFCLSNILIGMGLFAKSRGEGQGCGDKVEKLQRN